MTQPRPGRQWLPTLRQEQTLPWDPERSQTHRHQDLTAAALGPRLWHSEQPQEAKLTCDALSLQGTHTFNLQVFIFNIVPVDKYNSQKRSPMILRCEGSLSQKRERYCAEHTLPPTPQSCASQCVVGQAEAGAWWEGQSQGCLRPPEASWGLHPPHGQTRHIDLEGEPGLCMPSSTSRKMTQQNAAPPQRAAHRRERPPRNSPPGRTRAHMTNSPHTQTLPGYPQITLCDRAWGRQEGSRDST